MVVLMTPSATFSGISGQRYRRFFTDSALSAHTCVIHETVNYTLTFTYGGKEGGDWKWLSSHGGSPLEQQ